MVDSGRARQRDLIGFSSSVVDPPQNLSDEELKKYFDEVLDEAHEFIKHYDEEINEYYNENRPEGGWRWEQ